MYETQDGKEIERIEIDVSRLEELFERYALDLPDQYLSILDYLEYDIVNASTVVKVV